MTGAVRTSIEAIDELRRQLSVVANEVPGAAADAARRLEQALVEAQTAVAQRASELQHCEQALAACQRSKQPDCSHLVRAVAQARQRLDAAREAVRVIERTQTDHLTTRVRVEREVNQLVGHGRGLLNDLRADLTRYLAGSVGAAAVGASLSGGVDSSADAPPREPVPESANQPVPVAGAPVGFYMVPLALIDDRDSPVTGPQDFRKGFSPEDLTWAYTALHGVVLPALAAGHGREYFMELDQKQGLVGTRSYTDTYVGFFEIDDRIVLCRTPDGYSVSNGYHRIWVARQAGLTAVPAYVDGTSTD